MILSAAILKVFGAFSTGASIRGPQRAQRSLGWSGVENPPPQTMTALGILLFSSTVLLILYRYQLAGHAAAFPLYGYAGAGILLAGELLMFAKVEPVATYFTAVAWTGYILWADAAVYSLRGESLLRTYPAEFACIASCSIPLWLIFEAYNLRLENWTYVGLPENRLARTLGYGWAFATIWPGIFETAALLRGVGLAPNRKSFHASATARRRTNKGPARLAPLSILAGVLLLVGPLILPPGIRPYLFGAVWLGFIFLLEPINYRMGRESLWRDWEQGRSSCLISLLGAGLVCGFFWEFWNFWAQARWVYTFPIFPAWRIFSMPLPGYLGFPPFAVECFALFAFLVPLMNSVLEKLGAHWRFRPEALRI
jgi:hypothetical protein